MNYGYQEYQPIHHRFTQTADVGLALARADHQRRDPRYRPDVIGAPSPIGVEQQTTIVQKARLPWWFWLGGGVLIASVGYVVYAKIQEGRAKAAYIHKHAPGLLERFIPGFGKPAYEYSQAGRDVASDPEPPRDPEPKPMTLAYYVENVPQRDAPRRVIYTEPARDSEETEYP